MKTLEYIIIFTGISLVSAMVFLLSCKSSNNAGPSTAVAETGTVSEFSVGKYASALNTYVDEKGMVNYRALKSKRVELDEFTDLIGRLDPKIYNNWTETEKIAFWINAYNAFTLKAIIDNYPIKSSVTASLIYPKNSIRQIPGVWDKLEFTVMGRNMTLEEIEHNELRAKFNEPRIHMALVCAAIGCPPLRNEPYIAEKLDEQLDDQSRIFFGNPGKFRIERDNNKVYLSSIFKWFGDDFIKTYGTDGKFAGQSKSGRAVLNFAGKYLDKKDLDYILSEKYGIKYLDYDWTLNEQ